MEMWYIVIYMLKISFAHCVEMNWGPDKSGRQETT